ncbi:MAG: DNA mismatch repair endonuclease MutL, partial [Deltaproteobacteria bacterium]
MSHIKILPEIISNKIAAGEVVERPASVVKELVENALDAESTRIIVEVEKGGRSLIRVADNGMGMGRDDALLALERYATSKIFKDRDLYNIHTLGFRGEALPSIAAVSKFTLVSRDESSPAGTEIRVEGGKIRKVSEVGAPRGTMMSVAQLFYNTPARRKFLKTINTEMGHVVDIVSNMALARPEVQFKLLHNSKTVKNWPLVSNPADRVADLLGREAKTQLHPVEFETAGVMISGWISSPRFTRKTSRGIYIYVNGRFVRDKIIQHALFEGYAQRLVKGQFPVAVLFISVPYDQVDVNVHPTKSEVRFAEHRNVHDSVKRIVTQTLYRIDRPQWTSG